MVLQSIVDRLKGAREVTIKRLYKLVLRKALGNFLAGQLGVDQLDVKLIVLEDTPSSPGTFPSSTRQGCVQLTDLEINVDPLNGFLASQPLQLHKGRIGKVEVTVCYEKLLTEGLRIVLEDVELVLVRRKPEKGDEKGRNIGRVAEVRRKTKREEEKEKMEMVEVKAKEAANRRRSSSSSRGSEDASIIAEWIEQITTQLRVEVKGLKVRLVEGTSLSPSLPPSLPPSLLS